MTLDAALKLELSEILGRNVIFDEPMSRHTSFQVGGPAEAFWAAERLEDLPGVLSWARQRQIPYFIMGGGTNLLVKDTGIKGIVITLAKGLTKISCTEKKTDQVRVTAMAGAKMQSLCVFAIRNGLEGMNFALGIPGTVGGGIAMNAGTDGGSIENVLDAVRIMLPPGTTHKVPKEEFDFSYRKFSLKGHPARVINGSFIILEGDFCLRPSSPDHLQKDSREKLKARKTRQPTHLPSAGCFFQNPATGEKAGRLIDMAGLKGKKIGNAAISTKHANFIVNTGGASAADILSLMKIVQDTVWENFKIELKPEVKIIGT
ncbi:MAG: UDP-N-acetylmuramate dehydrogenase [Desulfobacterales bacterium]|nr:UDP-N-acetylmuramate dehydrogenase [Desulfobacterales bacterium]